MDARPVLMVTNTASGAARADAVAAAVAVLRRGRAVRVVGTTSPESLDAVLTARAPGEALVVAGGDGSLHALVAALDRGAGPHQGTGLDPADPVGVVPLGTGNDLARCLGIPLDPARAAAAYCSGRPRSLDLLADDRGRLAVNAVHVGVGAQAAKEAGSWKERLGTAGYAVGSALAGVKATGWRLRVEVDGQAVHDGSALMVGMGIGTTIGGGAPLVPDAAPDDGLVDVVVSESTGALARLGYALDLREGQHVERDDVVTARGRVVRVSGEDFPTNTDGEVDDPVASRTWRVRPAAWSVVVPA